VTFIASHKHQFGVEPICRVLSQHGWAIARSTYYDAASRAPSARARRDGELKDLIAKVHKDNYGVYGARKVWLTLNREGTPVARCTVARLMRELGLQGARRGRKIRTTVADPAAARPADLVRRQFSPPAPDRLWVADYTYVPTWAGMVYVSVTWNHHGVAPCECRGCPVASLRAGGDGGPAGDGCGDVWQVAGSGAARAGC
jgi:putative transposase